MRTAARLPARAPGAARGRNRARRPGGCRRGAERARSQLRLRRLRFLSSLTRGTPVSHASAFSLRPRSNRGAAAWTRAAFAAIDLSPARYPVEATAHEAMRFLECRAKLAVGD